MAAINSTQGTMALDRPGNSLRRPGEKRHQYRPQHHRRATRRGPLTKSEIERFKSALLAKRDELLGTLSEIRREVPMMDARDAGPMDSADIASIGQEIDEDHWLLQSESHVLDDIEQALERMRQGTYGFCQECRNPIPRRRLQVIPWARYCVPCAEGLESPQQRTNENERQKWAEECAYRLKELFEPWLKAHDVEGKEFYEYEMNELLDYYDDPLRKSLIESLC